MMIPLGNVMRQNTNKIDLKKEQINLTTDQKNENRFYEKQKI